MSHLGELSDLEHPAGAHGQAVERRRSRKPRALRPSPSPVRTRSEASCPEAEARISAVVKELHLAFAVAAGNSLGG